MRRFLLLTALLLPSIALAVKPQDEIRIDVPPKAQIKVRNDFGDVTVERWTNNYVAVSAAIEGSVKFNRSPIVIDNRGSSLMISVVRRPNDPVAAIHLQLKVPPSADVSGSSAQGEITVARDEPAKQPELIGVENAKRPAGTPATEPENEEISEGDVI